MRALMVSVLAVAVSGCTFGIKTCSDTSECNPGSTCEEGFCVAPPDSGTGGGSTGGGAGGGTTGGGGGTTTGGGMGGGGGSVTGGGGGGGDPMCPTMNCEEACIEGTGCVPFFSGIQIISPDAGAVLREGSTTLEVELLSTSGVVVEAPDYPAKLVYSIDDGGWVDLNRVAVTARYSGQHVLSNCTATKRLPWSVSLEDGGLHTSSSFECDGQEPTLELPMFSAGYYQRDDVVVFDLRADEPMNPASLQVRLGGVAMSEATMAMDGGTCTALGRCWALDMSKPELRGIDAGFVLTVDGTDLAGNPAAQQTTSLSVTRIRWSKRMSPADPVIAAPAVTTLGNVIIGTANTSSNREGSLFRIDPLTGEGGDAGVSLGAVQGVAVSRATTTAGMPATNEYAFVSYNYDSSSSPKGRLNAVDVASLTPNPAAPCDASGTERVNVAPALVRVDGEQVAGVASSNGSLTEVGRFLSYESARGCIAQFLSTTDRYALNHSSQQPAVNTIVVNAASAGAYALFANSFGQLRRVTALKTGSPATVESTVESLDGGGATHQAVFGSASLLSMNPAIGTKRMRLAPFGGTAKEWDFGNNVEKGAVAVQSSTEAYLGNGSTVVQFNPSDESQGSVPVSLAGAGAISTAPVLLAPRPGSTSDWGYAVSAEGSLIAFDRHGSALGWVAPLRAGNTVVAHPGFGCNTKPGHADGTGVLYVGWQDGFVQAIIVDGPTLDGLWPKYQRTMGNAGNDDTTFFPTNWACP